MLDVSDAKYICEDDVMDNKTGGIGFCGLLAIA